MESHDRRGFEMNNKIKTAFLRLLILLNAIAFGSQLYAKEPASNQCVIIKNASGYTPISSSKKLKKFQWLVINKGKIAGIGNKKIPSFYHNCESIDAHHHVIIPGLTDAHGHIAGLALELTQVNLRGLKTVNATVKKVAGFNQQNPSLTWLIGRGWNQVLWPSKKFPTHQDLDKVISEKPVLLERVDGHAIWVNAKAMKLAGIDRNTQSPSGGKIIKDKMGEPTGVFVDNATALFTHVIPEESDEQKQFALNKAFKYLLSLGIVGVHDAGINSWRLNYYQQVAKNHQLPIRIYAMLSGSDKNLHQWLENGPIYDDQDFLAIRSVKLYADGALGSRGAALLKPYSDDPTNKGLLRTKPKKMLQLMLDSISHGFQVNVHAIGDRGNRIVLDNFEKVFHLIGGKNLRNRIEHSQIVSLKDIPRFKKLNIIASMQPTHATSDMNMAEDRLGKERLKGAYAWRKFLDQGTIIASGSDFPVEHANAFYGLFSAVTRQDHHNQPKGGWLPKEKMTPTEALRSFTLDAAYAAFKEQKLGSLEIGKWADFIIIDKDVIEGKKADIWKTKVLQTWIAGKKVYQQ